MYDVSPLALYVNHIKCILYQSIFSNNQKTVMFIELCLICCDSISPFPFFRIQHQIEVSPIKALVQFSLYNSIHHSPYHLDPLRQQRVDKFHYCRETKTSPPQPHLLSMIRDHRRALDRVRGPGACLTPPLQYETNTYSLILLSVSSVYSSHQAEQVSK